MFIIFLHCFTYETPGGDPGHPTISSKICTQKYFLAAGDEHTTYMGHLAETLHNQSGENNSKYSMYLSKHRQDRALALHGISCQLYCVVLMSMQSHHCSSVAHFSSFLLPLFCFRDVYRVRAHAQSLSLPSTFARWAHRSLCEHD